MILVLHHTPKTLSCPVLRVLVTLQRWVRVTQHQRGRLPQTMTVNTKWHFKKRTNLKVPLFLSPDYWQQRQQPPFLWSLYWNWHVKSHGHSGVLVGCVFINSWFSKCRTVLYFVTFYIEANCVDINICVAEMLRPVKGYFSIHFMENIITVDSCTEFKNY